MASRFYYRPIDTGQDRFGAAIAAGMGQGIQNFRQGRATQEEQRRHDEAQRIAETLRAEDQARYEAAEAERLARAGVVPAGGPVVAAPSAVESAVAGAPPPTLPPSGPPTVGEAIYGGPAVPADMGPSAAMPAVPADMGPSAATPAPSFIEWTDPRSGEARRLDPSRSEAALTRANEFREQQAQAAEARQQIQNVIAQVLEDGEVSLDEMPLLRSWGIDPASLDDPTTAAQKAFDKWKKQYDIEQAGRRELANIQRGSVRDQLTAGQAENSAIRNILGMAGYLRAQGLNGQQIYQRLMEHQGLVGGEGALRGVIAQAIMEKEGLTPNQASQMAAQTLTGRMMFPGMPGYDQELIAETNALLDLYRGRESERRDIWGRAENEGGGDGGGGGGPVGSARSFEDLVGLATGAGGGSFSLTPGVAPSTPAVQPPDRGTIQNVLAETLKGRTAGEIRRSLGTLGATQSDIDWAVRTYAGKND
jgi:hypothetical protein